MMLEGIKRYTTFKTSSGRKIYCPVYNRNLIEFQRFPRPSYWEYEKASDAQAHGERYAKRKRNQEQRFTNAQYREAVMNRYKDKILAWANELQQDKNG